MGTGSVPHTPNVETITIKSLPDLIERVCLQTSAGYLWRGQTDSPDYKLRPGIFRKEADWKTESTKTSLFMRMAPARHAECPLNQVHWLFLMQHYGLKTRLLDWTKSPLIATYFAVISNDESEQELDGAVWGLNTSSLKTIYYPKNDFQILFPNSEVIVPLVSRAFGKSEHVDQIAALMPDQVDTRMSLQLSRFTVHGSPKALDDYPNHPNLLKKYIIPSSLKEDLRGELAFLGITGSNLFSDLGHLASDLNQNFFEAFL